MFDEKKKTYKIKLDPSYLSDIPKLENILSKIDEVLITSIKTIDCGCRIQFKFRGTESNLKDLIDVFTTEFAVEFTNIQRVLF